MNNIIENINYLSFFINCFHASNVFVNSNQILCIFDFICFDSALLIVINLFSNIQKYLQFLRNINSLTMHCNYNQRINLAFGTLVTESQLLAASRMLC